MQDFQKILQKSYIDANNNFCFDGLVDKKTLLNPDENLKVSIGTMLNLSSNLESRQD